VTLCRRTRVLRALLVLAASALATVAVAVAVIHGFFPRVRPARALRIRETSEGLARGRYLVEHVAVCVGCHSQRDFDRFGMPIVGRPGGGWGDRRRGGLAMEIEGLPGRIVPANITPDRETGIGRWSDGEIVRAIREGIRRDGSAIFPLMPYEDYRRMSDFDVGAIVQVLRRLEPVRRRVPRSAVRFPESTLMRLAPRPVDRAVAEPDRGDEVRYGEYLAALGGCIECHTPWIQGRRHEDELMSGGNRFRTRRWTVWAPNLTPDPETGLRLDEDQFVELFRQYRPVADGRVPARRAVRRNTVMPWLAFAGLEERDLRAIWRWLQSLPPIRAARTRG